MIIHSKFQDYYDSALGFGVDETIHYARKEEVLSNDHITISKELEERIAKFVKISMRFEYNHLFDGRKEFRTSSLNPSIEHTVIVIGQNVFVGALFTYMENAKPVTMFCDTLEDLKNACDKSGMKYNPEFETDSYYGYVFGKPKTSRQIFESNIEKTKQFVDKRFKEIEDLMVEFNTPILVFTKGEYDGRFKVTKDAFLKPYGIVSKIDPFQTFQEISMFMGNVLCNNEPDMIEISDNHKRDGKGFDEISFKNRGGKKPRRKTK